MDRALRSGSSVLVESLSQIFARLDCDQMLPGEETAGRVVSDEERGSGKISMRRCVIDDLVQVACDARWSFMETTQISSVLSNLRTSRPLFFRITQDLKSKLTRKFD